MPTQGEVRFATALKEVIAKIKGITGLTSETEEASIYAQLEGLAADIQLWLPADNPKRAVVGKMITDQVAYYNVTRKPDPTTGKIKRSRQATAGHVADMLAKIYPILEVDPVVLVKEVEVPKTAASAVSVPPPAPADLAPSTEPIRGEEKGTPWGLIIGGAAALYLATTFLRR